MNHIWTRLFERSGGQVERNTTEDPDLHVVLDSKRRDPAVIEGGVYTFALNAPLAAGLSLRSLSGVPSLVGGTPHDHRRLGVAIARIAIHQSGMTISITPEATILVDGGCYPSEGGHSWTDGELTLPAHLFAFLQGPFTLTVRIERPGMRYPLSTAMAIAA